MPLFVKQTVEFEPAEKVAPDGKSPPILKMPLLPILITEFDPPLIDTLPATVKVNVPMASWAGLPADPYIVIVLQSAFAVRVTVFELLILTLSPTSGIPSASEPKVIFQVEGEFQLPFALEEKVAAKPEEMLKIEIIAKQITEICFGMRYPRNFMFI